MSVDSILHKVMSIGLGHDGERYYFSFTENSVLHTVELNSAQMVLLLRTSCEIVCRRELKK